jgi:hypothetical protein
MTTSNLTNEDGTPPLDESPHCIRLEYPNEGKHLVIDQEVSEKLRTAYNQAMADKCDAFMFQGHKFLTSYAKYMLEYIDGRLGNDQKRTDSRDGSVSSDTTGRIHDDSTS